MPEIPSDARQNDVRSTTGWAPFNGRRVEVHDTTGPPSALSLTVAALEASMSGGLCSDRPLIPDSLLQRSPTDRNLWVESNNFVRYPTLFFLN